MRQQNSGAVEDFILVCSAVYLRIQSWKNYWNRSTFAKVTVKIKVAQFFKLTVCLTVTSNWYAVIFCSCWFLKVFVCIHITQQNNQENDVLYTGCQKYKPCPHCRIEVRLSHKSETVAEKCDCRRYGETTATVALFCDIYSFFSHFSATVWTGFNKTLINLESFTRFVRIPLLHCLVGSI